MGKYLKNIVLLSIIVLFSACEKEAKITPKTYPYVITMDVTEIDHTGARFTANMLDKGEERILDLGFMWYTNDSINNWQVSIMEKDENRQDFTYKVSSDLVNGIEYFCRAYIQTANYLVLGNKVTFSSLGSELPIIKDFFPKTGNGGTEVSIVGKHFSHNPVNNKIFVDGIQAKIIFSSADLIVFVIPPLRLTGEVDLSLKVNFGEVTADDKFEMTSTSNISISVNSSYSGDFVTLEMGDFFIRRETPFVYFDQYPSEIINISGTYIKAIVPVPYENLLSDDTVKITIENGIESVVLSEEFIIKKSWTEKQAYPIFEHSLLSAFVHNDKGYLIDYQANEIQEYDPETDRWSSFISYPGVCVPGSIVIPLASKVLFLESAPFYGKWSYDFTSNTWSAIDSIPFGFSSATNFMIDNEVFIITNQSQCWKYTPDNEVFVRLNDFPFEFDLSVSSFVSDGVAFLTLYESTWQYNPQNDNWIEKSTNPFMMDNYSTAMGFSYKNTGFVLYQGKELYRYDKDINKWILTSIFPFDLGPNPEPFATAFVIGDFAYIANTSLIPQDARNLLFSYQFNSLSK